MAPPQRGRKPFRETGRRLESIRKQLGYATQKELAKLIGIEAQTYSQFATGGRQLTLEPALELHKRFGISLDWLYFGYEPAIRPERLQP